MHRRRAFKKLGPVVILTGLLLMIFLTVVQRGAAQPPVQVGINGADCNYSHIAAAIVAAQDGDTIYIDVGQAYTGSVIGLVDKDVTIAAATNNCRTPTDTLAIVDGSGHRDASGGLMTVDQSQTVSLSHVRLQNAQADRGGIVDINADGTLILESSGIASGTAGIAGGGLYLGVGSSLILRDESAVFANSVTETSSTGAGIYAISGTITMTNSYLGGFGTGQGNASANRGGGVFLDRSSLYADNSLIFSNDADTKGGGVYAQNDSVVETAGTSIIGDSSSYFLGNYADDGAGIFLDRDSVLVMYDDSQVSFNAATNFGGGVYAGPGSIVDMESAGTRIYSNTATFGGGAVISGTGASLYMETGAQVVDNLAAGAVANGGGIYAANGGLVSGEGARIVGNHADLLGGGIHLIQGGGSPLTQFLLDDGGQIQDNSAANGGAINISTGNTSVTIADSQVGRNTALETGGGIYVFGNSDVYVAGSVISGNVADGADGGGLAMRDGQVVIDESRISYNTAITNGGGIRQTGGVITALNSVLDGNAAQHGGALYVKGATSALTNVRILRNSSVAGHGGGVFAGAGSRLRIGADFNDCDPLSLPFRFYCSEVSYNDAAGQGAGIYVEDGQAFIGHTAFLSNEGSSPSSHGAALMVGTSAEVTATDTLFTGHGRNEESTVHVYNQANYHSENSTYAGNADVPLFVVSQGTAELNRNVVWENGAALDIQGTISSQCNDTESGLSGGFANFSADPRFVETSRGLYRLGPGSPAIDACSPGISERGLDGRRRGIIIRPGHTLVNYDVGAFEAPIRVHLPTLMRSY
jgi:hypothetical protein